MNVAVLISVYHKDNSEWFEQALKSIFNQNFDGKINVYLGVDGKLSDSLNLIYTKYQTKFFKIIHSTDNLGLTKMLNRLIDELEDEEFIFRADSDDINNLDRFQKQTNFLNSHPHVDIVGSAIQEIDENGNIILEKVSYPLTHEGCREFFKRRDPLAHPAVCFRKSYFTKAGKYNPEFRTNQDTYLWMCGFLAGCIFANLDEVLISFRRSPKFYDRRGGIERAKNLLKLRIQICKNLHFGIDAYFYAILIFLFTLMPSELKKLMYQNLRS